MKKVVVTGANGFVGQYLTKALTDRGYQVWAVVKDTDEDISGISYPSVQIVYCDLMAIAKLPNIIHENEFEMFFHLAWAGSSGALRKNFDLQLENAKASGAAVIAAAKLGCKRFIGAGSVTELMYRDYFHENYSETEMVCCYAIGKISAEYICRCLCKEYDVEFVWGYLSNFYGVGDLTQNFVNFVIKTYLSGESPALTSGEQLADFMYVSDIARALMMLGEAGQPGCNYYVGFGSPKPLKYFVEIMNKVVNKDIDSGLGRKQFYGRSIDFEQIDLHQLSRDTGFCPQINFADGIKMTAEWLKNGDRGIL